MLNSRQQRVTLNIIDASTNAWERWSQRCRTLDAVHVECHADVPTRPESLAEGLWVLVPDTFDSDTGQGLVALTHELPESAHVMVIQDCRDLGPECSDSIQWIAPGETERAIHRALKSMVRAYRAEQALDSALKFPSENPNPVLSFKPTGELLYANPAATLLLDQTDEYGVTLLHRLQEEAEGLSDGSNVVVSLEHATYGFRFESDDLACRLNVYGIDITENLAAIEGRVTVEKQSRYKDIFLAAMSHELRTPLNAVLSCTEAMREGTYGPLGLQQLEAVNTIRRSGKHLLSLISDILDISKIEAGRLEVNPVPLSVQAVCDSVMEIVRVAAEDKNIKLSLTNVGDVTVFNGDPLRIKQVLLNLVGNAIKFTPEYGEVGLEVSEGQASGTIAFRIWDTGPGISAAHSDTIFKSFVQAEDTTANSHPGTGLGLTIARHLTRLHEGDLTLDSLDGPGAVFMVTLPIGDVAEESVFEFKSSDSWNFPGVHSIKDDEAKEIEKVLIAEDTDSNYQHLHDMLVSLGYTVDRAFNGQEAVEMCQSMRPDLVLMDIDMPYVNGIDAIREIRQDIQHDGLPIIAVTAMSGIADEHACLQAGANGFLAKPYPLRDLMMMMQQVSA